MTTKKPAPNAPEPEQAAAGEREDPLTSFDPGPGEAAGTPPAAPHRQGNGSEQTLRRPGETGAPAAAGAPAQSPAGAAQPAPEAPQDAAGAGTGEPGAAQQAPETLETPETLAADALEEARQEAAAAAERVLRLQAEFENYKKRIQKEHADALRFALAPLVTEVAAIMDNLERAVEHVRKEPGDGVAPLLEGVEMVVRQMREALGRFGVRRIDAVGKPFDPALHEAINVVETQDAPENQVLEEYQAGYLLHDRVVRPARVCVSKRAAEPPADAPPAESRS
jgi:molecular chaperone GrpE